MSQSQDTLDILRSIDGGKPYSTTASGLAHSCRLGRWAHISQTARRHLAHYQETRNQQALDNAMMCYAWACTSDNVHTVGSEHIKVPSDWIDDSTAQLSDDESDLIESLQDADGGRMWESVTDGLQVGDVDTGRWHRVYSIAKGYLAQYNTEMSTWREDCQKRDKRYDEKGTPDELRTYKPCATIRQSLERACRVLLWACGHDTKHTWSTIIKGRK